MAKSAIRLPRLHAKTAILAALVLFVPLFVLVASSKQLQDTRSSAAQTEGDGGGNGSAGKDYTITIVVYQDKDGDGEYNEDEECHDRQYQISIKNNDDPRTTRYLEHEYCTFLGNFPEIRASSGYMSLGLTAPSGYKVTKAAWAYAYPGDKYEKTVDGNVINFTNYYSGRPVKNSVGKPTKNHIVVGFTLKPKQPPSILK